MSTAGRRTRVGERIARISARRERAEREGGPLRDLDPENPRLQNEDAQSRIEDQRAQHRDASGEFAEFGQKENKDVVAAGRLRPSPPDLDPHSPTTEPLYVMRKHAEVHLYLCKMQLLRIAPDIRHFRHLKVLQICCNGLRELPEEVSELSQLVVLYAARNKLERLPSALSRMESLRELNVSGNRLMSLPPSFRFFRSLESLDLSDNPFDCLPPVIPYIAPLKSLSVRGTCIRYFPPEILRLVFLNELLAPSCVSTLTSVCPLLQAYAETHSLQFAHDSVVVRRKEPVDLEEKILARIIMGNRGIRSNTPARTLLRLLSANECSICARPLFSPFASVFTRARVCETFVVLRLVLCRNHAMDYTDPLRSLRASLFLAKAYAGDASSVPFIFEEEEEITRTPRKKQAAEKRGGISDPAQDPEKRREEEVVRLLPISHAKRMLRRRGCLQGPRKKKQEGSLW